MLAQILFIVLLWIDNSRCFDYQVSEKLNPNIKIFTNTSNLREDGQWIQVYWRGVENPKVDDWIGVFPLLQNFSQHAPISYKPAILQPNYLSTGCGQFRWKIYNHGVDLVFGLLRGELDNSILLAKSEVLQQTNPNEPTQGHLAISQNNSELTVSWVTGQDIGGVVKWGQKSGEYDFSTTLKTATYHSSDLCGSPGKDVGWIPPGYVHTATISNLIPRKRYYYVYGNNENGGYSSEKSFVAPPKIGDFGEETYQIGIFADVGVIEEDGSISLPVVEYGSKLVIDDIIKNKDSLDLLILNGDVSYADGFASNWDKFFHHVEPIATAAPFMVSVGNHEFDFPGSGDVFDYIGGSATQDDSGGECGIPYSTKFKMPKNNQNNSYWYSFDFGPVHFLQFSTEHSFEKGSAQYEFIYNDLKQVDRSVTPWILVGGHRPMYVDSTKTQDPAGHLVFAQLLRNSLEDLFYQFEVDLVFSGHHHSYQRSCPVYKQKCQGYNSHGEARGPIYVLAGNGGHELDGKHMWSQSFSWLQVMKMQWGWVRIEVNTKHLKCSAVDVQNNNLLDEFILQKRAIQNFHQG